MRHRSLFAAPALLVVLLGAAAGCDHDPGPDGGASNADADVDLCAGWTPSSETCDLERCLYSGDCAMESCDPSTGETVRATCARPVPPPPEIEGNWTLFAFLPPQDDPCPEVKRLDIRLVTLERTSETTCAVLDREGYVLGTGDVLESTGTAEVTFTLSPTWRGPEGAAVPAAVAYDLVFGSGGDVFGHATATASSGDATCSYAFQVTGRRG